MMPYDGNGYGTSSYWQFETKYAATVNNEFCPCWHFDPPKITIDPEIDDKGHCSVSISISCQDKQEFCQESFPKTENDIKEKFLIFYKG